MSQGPRVTLADVAARAGVHPATASRALSPDRQPMIGPGTVQRVVQAAADLAYEPDLVARALRTQRSFTVGVLMPGPEDPSVLPLLRGVEDRLAAAGYATLLAGPGGADREAAVARLRARHVDGLIIPGAVLASTARASAPPDAWPPGLPVVVADGPPARPASRPPPSTTPTARGWSSTTSPAWAIGASAASPSRPAAQVPATVPASATWPPGPARRRRASAALTPCSPGAARPSPRPPTCSRPASWPPSRRPASAARPASP